MYFIFWIKNCYLLIPRAEAFIKDVQATGAALKSLQKRTSSTSEKKIYQLFFYFCESFLHSWIRNTIESGSNPVSDRDPDPEHWLKGGESQHKAEIWKCTACMPVPVLIMAGRRLGFLGREKLQATRGR
jgi:hypothetical protein